MQNLELSTSDFERIYLANTLLGKCIWFLTSPLPCFVLSLFLYFFLSFLVFVCLSVCLLLCLSVLLDLSSTFIFSLSLYLSFSLSLTLPPCPLSFLYNPINHQAMHGQRRTLSFYHLQITIALVYPLPSPLLRPPSSDISLLTLSFILLYHHSCFSFSSVSLLLYLTFLSFSVSLFDILSVLLLYSGRDEKK